MRILSTILIAALCGGAVGGAVAYVQVRNDLDPVTAFPGETEITLEAKNQKLPQVQVVESNFKFGAMQRGTSMSHDFEIRNTGEAPLVLKAGSTSCKCTLSEVSGAPVPPGGSTKVKLQWSAKSDNGPFRQTATITTNDPLHSSIELSVDGSIMSASGVEPAEVVFDKVPVGESKSTHVYVMAMLQDDLKVADPVFSDATIRDKFVARIEPVEPKDLPNKSARRGVRVTVTVQSGLPVGRFHQWLSLKTNLAQAESLEIPVVGQVVGDISVHGTGWSEERGALNIGNVKSSEGARNKLSIIVRGADASNTTFAIKSVDPPELKATLGVPKKLKDTLVQVPLEIEIPIGTRPMVHLDTAQGEPGRIILSTTHPKIKELSVNVLFAVER